MSLELFVKDLNDSILSESRATGDSPELVFTRTAIEYLVDAGECIDPEPVQFKGRGFRFDAWDMHEETASLDLFVTHFFSSTQPSVLTLPEVLDDLSRGRRFLERSIEGSWGELEGSGEPLDVANEIHAHAGSLQRVRIYLLTNGVAPSRELDDVKLGRLRASHEICDAKRLQTIADGGAGRQPIELTKDDLGGGIPCVAITSENGAYDAYVGVVSGRVLSDLYQEWGDRLLEQNVRSYLQARGKVNRSILKTIEREPGMFLAYNNGISTTAEAATIEKGSGRQLLVTGLRNFQIVNGAQTTASLHSAGRTHGLDLSEIYVQVKLTVLKDPMTAGTIVPMISLFANSQTKVNVSDFSANDPFQVALWNLSQQTWTPATSAHPSSKWYYERTRGHYLSELGKQETPAKRKTFTAQYPKTQVITKTMAAKYEMSWGQQPHVVSLGAEKNFSHFIDAMGPSPRLPDVAYFRRLVALAVLCQECDRLVESRNFGGYKANVVTYTVAWLSYLTAQCLDLEAIWNTQAVGPKVQHALNDLATEVWAILNAPPSSIKNVTEWSKKEACWKTLKGRSKKLTSLGNELGAAPAQPAVPTTPGPGGMMPPAEAAALVSQAEAVPSDVWFRLAAWAKRTGNLQPWERSLAFSVGRIRGRGDKPTEKQARHAVRILEFATEKGFSKEQAS
jgi:hypothetical protein